MHCPGVLSNRQIEALQLLADGLRYKHISQHFGINYDALKKDVNQACVLFDVYTTHQAIAEGFRRGILR